MNLHRLPEYLIRWTVTICGILLALMLAKSAGGGSYGMIFGVFLSLAAITIALRFKEKIWVSIPIFWGLTGQIASLGIPLGARDITILFVFIAFLTLRAFKIVRKQPTFGGLEILALIMGIYVVISFIRNPVGVDVLNSDRVGGRPYFNCFVAFLACWVLRQTTLRPESANRLAFTMTAGRMIEGVLAQFLLWIPALAGFFALYYTCGFFVGLGPTTATPIPGTESTGRLGHLAAIGQPLLIYLCCRFSLKSFFYPNKIFWLLLLAVGTLCVLLSGFRSTLSLCIGAFVLAEFIRYRWRGVAFLAGMGAAVLIIVMLGNGTLFNLPLSAQRGLSWLPGKWDTYAKLEAAESTRWRTDMWKLMLFTDRYIENKVLGDGFGFSKRQFDTIMAIQLQGGSSAEGQESFMITGAVHSGPVGSVRHGGYVGLVILLVLLFALMREAWRMIQRTRRTPYQLLALFVCIPVVIQPFFFILVIGAYENAIPDSLYTIGMLRMLANSLAAYEREPVPTMAQVSPERRRLVPTTNLACSLRPPVLSNGACE